MENGRALIDDVYTIANLAYLRANILKTTNEERMSVRRHAAAKWKHLASYIHSLMKISFNFNDKFSLDIDQEIIELDNQIRK